MLLTLEALTRPSHAFRWRAVEIGLQVGRGCAKPTRGDWEIMGARHGNQSSSGICRGKVDEEQRCRNPNQRGEDLEPKWM
jgi:hypothetical protein